MALQEFRKECRDRARQLEQLVISDVSRGATDLDPSALLAEARRSYLASFVQLVDFKGFSFCHGYICYVFFSVVVFVGSWDLDV